jgi:hypothetical protein
LCRWTCSCLLFAPSACLEPRLDPPLRLVLLVVLSYFHFKSFEIHSVGQAYYIFFEQRHQARCGYTCVAQQRTKW